MQAVMGRRARGPLALGRGLRGRGPAGRRPQGHQPHVGAALHAELGVGGEGVAAVAAGGGAQPGPAFEAELAAFGQDTPTLTWHTYHALATNAWDGFWCAGGWAGVGGAAEAEKRVCGAGEGGRVGLK